MTVFRISMLATDNNKVENRQVSLKEMTHKEYKRTENATYGLQFLYIMMLVELKKLRQKPKIIHCL